MHADDFEIKPETYQSFTPSRYPSDIRRILSKGTHRYRRRFYFFNPSHRRVYKLSSPPLQGYQIYNSKENLRVYLRTLALQK